MLQVQRALIRRRRAHGDGTLAAMEPPLDAQRLAAVSASTRNAAAPAAESRDTHLGHFCDVALDTEVFNGHTTSRCRAAAHTRRRRLHNCRFSEMLWMGLPLISAINSTQPFGRLTAGLLKSSSIAQHPPLSSSSHVLSPWHPVRSAALSSFPPIALPPSVLLARDLNEFVHPLHFYHTKQKSEALLCAPQLPTLADVTRESASSVEQDGCRSGCSLASITSPHSLAC